MYGYPEAEKEIFDERGRLIKAFIHDGSFRDYSYSMEGMIIHHYDADKKLLQTEFYSPGFILLKVIKSDGRVFHFAEDGITLVSIEFPDGRIVPFHSLPVSNIGRG
ncbi:MAG: hypothetical protein M1536_08685 [Firmicutes bacterium]|nr:hypothetical protein [Bacillota bacterium]